MAKVNIPTVKLNNGAEMPALGYGTWLGLNQNTEFDCTDVPKLVDVLSYAIDIGYRHIDTAHLYRVEPEVGEVINKKIKEGVVKREDLFVTTKVWHNYHREADVEVSVRDSLRRLNLDYVDLILMHWPLSISLFHMSDTKHGQELEKNMLNVILLEESVIVEGGICLGAHKKLHIVENRSLTAAKYVKQEGVDEKIDYLETWRGFESVLQKGLAKAIGVSNFNLEQMKRLLANCKVPPASNQIEINLNLGQKELVDYCQSQKVVVVAYSPFGTMVPSRSVPNSPEPKMNNPTLTAIAAKYGKTVTQVTLRYLYQRDIVSIPKTVTKSRVLENAAIFDFVLDEDDVQAIAKFDNGYRTVRPVFWQTFSNYPFDKVELGEIMKIPPALIKWKNGINQNID